MYETHERYREEEQHQQVEQHYKTMTTTMHAHESHKNKLSSSTMYSNDNNNYSSNGENSAFLFQCPPEHVKELNAVKAAFAISHHYFDGWIYLFLANKKYDIAETIAKLKRRADMEQHVFRQYTITPSLRTSMCAGIVQYIGDDKAGRPVLYFNTSRDQPKASERAWRQANFDIFLSWAVRLQRSNPTSGVTWLINQHHASLLRNTDLVFQKDMALRTSKFYPGTVARMYLCNMNSALTFVMKPLLRQLPKAISETIFIYSNHDLKSGKLLEVMDDHVLPIAMGGSNDCDHPSNYEWFANQVEHYFSRCVHALNNHISIKEMEMMEEFHVDVHGRPLVETVKSAYEKDNYKNKNENENEIEKTKTATKVDETKETGLNNTDLLDKIFEFRSSENKENKEEELKEEKERLEQEEQLTRSTFSARETRPSNTTTSNLKSTSISAVVASTTVQHQTCTINRSNKNSNNASNNLLSLLVDGDDGNDNYDSDDSNLKTPIEVCSSGDDDDIVCGECMNNKYKNSKDKHESNTIKHSHELTNKQKDNYTSNNEDMKREIDKNNRRRNEEVNSVAEIEDSHNELVHTKGATDVNIHKNWNNIETTNESHHVHLHDNNIPFSQVSHVMEQTPLSVAFDDDQVVITSNRYKSEVRWNDRHIADELPLDISYNNSNCNNNTDNESTKENNKSNVIEEHKEITQSAEREFSLHDSFASGLISTSINDLLSFNPELHEYHESYLDNNNSESSEGKTEKVYIKAGQMTIIDVTNTNNTGNKIEEIEIENNNVNDGKANEQSRQSAKQLEFANNTNVNINNNMRQKSTLVECATSKEYREFVSYYISYKVIEIAKHIKCNKPDEINVLKENWNAFVDVCYTLQHPVEHIIHVLHGQTTNKAVCKSTSSYSNCLDDDISENKSCTNSVESVVEFIKAHVTDITRLIQHLLLLSVPSSHVLYILSNGCISATSSPLIEDDYWCKDNQEHNTTSMNAIKPKETIKKEIFEEKEQHQVNTREKSMLEPTRKNNNELVCLLEPLEVDCTSADNLLLSLQASTVVFVEQCEQMIELHKTHERVLRRTLLTWSNNLSPDEYVLRLAQRAKTLWNELVPWLRQYIECKVHMAIASFMAYYGLLIAHGKIDTTSDWYKTLFRSILHFREVHRHSWLFHLLPPFTFTNTQKETQNTNTTNNSSMLLPESNLENIKEEVSEEQEFCFHVHAPSVSELLKKSHLPESTEGLCTLIVMVERSLKATLQQLQKITSMAAQWQVEDDLASPIFPATSEANSKTTTDNSSKTKIKNSSFFGKTMQNLTSCNSYNNSNHNGSFANSTQPSQKNNNNSSDNNNTTNSSNTTTVPPILYTNHCIIDRYLEYSHARISIPFESQSMGLSPVEMIVSEQIKACAFLTAAETPLKEFLFTNASLYLLSSCSASSFSHELTQQIQMHTPSTNEEVKKLNEKQERKECINCEELHKEDQINDICKYCKRNEEPDNNPITTSSISADDANVMMNSFTQDNVELTDQAIHVKHNLDNVEVKSENKEFVKNDADNINTDFNKTISPHTKLDAHLSVMQREGCNEEGHSIDNNCVIAEQKSSTNKNNKNSNAEFTAEANNMQTINKHELALQLSKIHNALREERCQRRICTALAMAAYHVQCNGTIYGYGGTEDTDEFIKTFQSRSKTNIKQKYETDQIICRNSKQDDAHKKHKEQKATSLESNNAENTNANTVSIVNSKNNNHCNEWPSYGSGLALQLMEMLAYLTWHDESKQLTKIENEQEQQLESRELGIRDVNVFDINDTNKSVEKKRNNVYEKELWEETENQEQELLSTASFIESPTTTHNVVEQNVYLCSSNNTNNSNITNAHNSKKKSNLTNMSTNTETSKTELLQDVQVLIDNTRHANEYALPVAEAKRQYIFMTFTN